MRRKSEAERRIMTKKLVENHSWYNELVNKVVVLNGAKREVTSQEMIILEELKRFHFLCLI